MTFNGGEISETKKHLHQGAQKQTGENQKVVWAEFSTLS
jgi:hypothetical protein